MNNSQDPGDSPNCLDVGLGNFVCHGLNPEADNVPDAPGWVLSSQEAGDLVVSRLKTGWWGFASNRFSVMGTISVILRELMEHTEQVIILSTELDMPDGEMTFSLVLLPPDDPPCAVAEQALKDHGLCPGALTPGKVIIASQGGPVIAAVMTAVLAALYRASLVSTN